MATASGEARLRCDLPLPLLHRGKVREMYEAGPDHLLMVATDRISAFDVVMNEPIPRKGEVLTMLTAWWLARLERSGIPGFAHHAVSADPERILEQLPELGDSRDRWARRALLVRRTAPFPVECVVRGYLSGSAWREYRSEGTLAGEPLAPGMVESGRFDTPRFSPATKATEGHDENIPFGGVVDRIGATDAARLRELSLAIYRFGAEVAAERGILLAATKFEFGRTPEGRILLIDEVLTPDSSRYWPEEGWREGGTPPSLDKQPVRDYLDGVEGWDHAPPAPPLPDEVVLATTERYLEIVRRLTGVELDELEPPAFEGARDPSSGRNPSSGEERA